MCYVLFILSNNIFSLVKKVNSIDDNFRIAKSNSASVLGCVENKIQQAEKCILKYLEETERYQYLKSEGFGIAANEIVTQLYMFELDDQDVLFFAKIKDGLLDADNTFFIFVYSKKNQKISEKVCFISLDGVLTGVSDSLITGPLISYDKNFLDNNRLLKIKQFGHNGTNYNAEITNYFEVDVNFNLVRIFSLETMCLYPGDRGGHVVRNIRQISQSKFEVITELVDSGNKEKKMIVAKGYLEKKHVSFV